MKAAMDFEEARIGLSNQIKREITELKKNLEEFDEKAAFDYDSVAKAAERIFYAAEGLKKLSNVLDYIDCWEENDEPPQISWKASD